MSLRSAHFHVTGPSCRIQVASSYCSNCDVQVLPDADRARMTNNEVRWLHVQHLLASCTDQCDVSALCLLWRRTSWMQQLGILQL